MIALKFSDIIEKLSSILEYKSDLLKLSENHDFSFDPSDSKEDFDRLGNLYQLSKKNGPRKLSSIRNRQGMFYSPEKIAEFMTEHTIKQKMDEIFQKLWSKLEKSNEVVEEIFCKDLFEDLSHFSVLDPACGSGIFLIYAIRQIYSFYLKIYEIINESSIQDTIKFKMRDIFCIDEPVKLYEKIITRHIYGVDIDPISLDIVKINVFLELLRLIFLSKTNQIDANAPGKQTENQPGKQTENQPGKQTINQLAEEICRWPFFSKNLKIGNALVFPPLPDEYKLGILQANSKQSVQSKIEMIKQHFNEWMENKRISFSVHDIFLWINSFPQVFLKNSSDQEINEDFKDGRCGFSLIIGNPPWGSSLYVNKIYVQERFQYKIDNINSFEVFILSAFELLKADGLFSFIIPRNFIKANDYTRLREMLLKNYQIELIADTGCSFKHVAQESVILTVKKNRSDTHFISLISDFHSYLKDKEESRAKRVLQSEFLKIPDFIINLNFDEKIEDILKKIENKDNVTRLADLVYHGRGIEYGKNGKVILCPECNHYCEPPTKKHTEKTCSFCNVQIPRFAKHYTIISETKDKRHSHPIFVGKHLSKYDLQAPYYLDITIPGIKYKNANTFAKKKILLMKISESIKATIDYSGAYCTQALYFLIEKRNDLSLEHILAILNSKLMAFYYEHRFNIGASITTNVTLANILRLPIIHTNNSKLENLVKEIFSRKDTIKEIENQIDILVFELYGMTPAEVNFINSYY